jgi:hypothetical protein
MIRQIGQQWSKFRSALLGPDHKRFDRLLPFVRYSSPPVVHRCAADPRETIVLSIFWDLRRRISAIEGRLLMPRANGLPEPQSSFDAADAEHMNGCADALEATGYYQDGTFRSLSGTVTALDHDFGTSKEGMAIHAVDCRKCRLVSLLKEVRISLETIEAVLYAARK